MTLLGYALVHIQSGAVIERTGLRLPVRVTVSGVGVCDFDRAGLVVPDSGKPTHVFAERWLVSDEPDGRYRVSSEVEEYDGTLVLVTRGYEALPQMVPEEVSRRQLAQGLALTGDITEAEALAWAGGAALPAALQLAVDSIPDAGSAFDMAMLLRAYSFQRSHPATLVFGSLFGKSDEQIDALWTSSSGL